MNKFKLQTALKVRERLEKLYQKSFAEQVQVTQRLTDQLNILEEAFKKTVLQSILLNEMVSRSQIWLSEWIRPAAKYHQSVVQDQMTEQQELMERRRQELVSATQQKRVLEILREKHELRERRSFKERRL